MSIQLLPPKRKRDYWSAGFSGIVATLEALSPSGPNVPNVLSNLKSGFGALLGLPEDDISNRAWVWAFKTLNYASAEVLKTERIKAPLSNQKDEAIEEFLEAATCFNNNELDGIAMMNPSLSPLFANAQKALGPMILKATTGVDLGLTNLEERFKQALRTGSNRTLCEDPAYFRVLEDGLTGLAGEGARRDGHWARHAHWISHYFTDAPIFSTDEDEVIPLEAVYLPLRCFWHRNEKTQEEDGSEKVHKTAYVTNLHSTAHEWLSGDARYDPIRVVTGGPGSGKSSFARAFAHEVIQKDAHRVLFVQLQHMTLTGSLYDDITRYVDRRDTSTGRNGNPGLPGNPLEWRKTDEKPILMIFDGLDELSTKEEDGERYARELLVALKLMLSPMNNDGSPIRALVLGRDLACQAAMEASNIPLEKMLNAARIAKMTNEAVMMPAQAKGNIQDVDKLMEVDQRKDYWRKWADIKGLDPEAIPKAITADSMKELNVEPLLLHLLLISKYSEEDWEIAADNKNFVYQDILQKIFERNKHKDHFRAAGVTEPLFFELMECLGIAAWRGNGRTGDENDFRQIRKLHLNREKKFKDFPAASLESVALNIHTRAGEEGSSSGFEFIHKSFGEYLAARGLLSHSLKTAKALETQEPEDVEQPWSQIIGPAELTSEIIGFLYNEARVKLTPDQATERKDALTELINWALIQGFSVHKVSPQLPWTDLAARQRSAISALIASTSAIATAIPLGDWDTEEYDAPWTVNIRWPRNTPHSLRAILNGIGVTIDDPVAEAFRRINLADEYLWNSSLNRTNLQGADLRGTMITRCTLIGSSFSGANLSRTHAHLTNIIESDLSGCELFGAEFDEATLSGVDMRHSNLKLASFRGVNASQFSDFQSANRFTEASIKGAIDFEGADLTEADLSDADLSGVINLSLDAVNSATGTIGTILPEYIDKTRVSWLQEDTARKEAPSKKSLWSLRRRRHI